MQTASDILAAKGYDPAQQNDIVCANSDCLDLQTREHFNVNEPIHLYECYYAGDANEDALNETARAAGHENYHALLSAMDRYLVQLAENYPARKKS